MLGWEKLKHYRALVEQVAPLLALAGSGPYPGAMTQEVTRLLSKASKVYVDTYTNPQSRWLVEEARRVAEGEVVEAARETLEEGARTVVEEARTRLVVVLVPGDPLIATTHVALLAEARRAGVEARYYPGVSGVCAAKAASLLHYYRFGRTVTVPGPWRGVKAHSVVEAVYSNLCVGLHTLLLLDVDSGGRQLAPGEASRIILEAEEELASATGMTPSLGRLPAIAVSVGPEGDHRVHAFKRLSDLELLDDAGGRVYSLIIPARLHPTEAWALKEVYGVEVEGGEEYARAEKACSLLEFSSRGASFRGL
jgi:diphthine synthase